LTTKAIELVEFARRNGHTRAELHELIEALP